MTKKRLVGSEEKVTYTSNPRVMAGELAKFFDRKRQDVKPTHDGKYVFSVLTSVIIKIMGNVKLTPNFRRHLSEYDYHLKIKRYEIIVTYDPRTKK